jgi:PAS domain-containing protein
MTGLPAEAVLADPAAAYDLFLPDHRERVVEAEAAAIRELAHFDVEAPMRRPDGSILWTRIVSAPRHVGDHLIWGMGFTSTTRLAGKSRSSCARASDACAWRRRPRKSGSGTSTR